MLWIPGSICDICGRFKFCEDNSMNILYLVSHLTGNIDIELKLADTSLSLTGEECVTDEVVSSLESWEITCRCSLMVMANSLKLDFMTPTILSNTVFSTAIICVLQHILKKLLIKTIRLKLWLDIVWPDELNVGPSGPSGAYLPCVKPIVHCKVFSKGGGGGSHCVKQRVLTRLFLRVCPREDQAVVTHAISPISLKLSQMVMVIKLFQRSLGSRVILGVQELSHQIPGIKPRN